MERKQRKALSDAWQKHKELQRLEKLNLLEECKKVMHEYAEKLFFKFGEDRDEIMENLDDLEEEYFYWNFSHELYLKKVKRFKGNI